MDWIVYDFSFIVCFKHDNSLVLKSKIMIIFVATSRIGKNQLFLLSFWISECFSKRRFVKLYGRFLIKSKLVI